MLNSPTSQARDLAQKVLLAPENTATLALDYVIERVKAGTATFTPTQIKDLKELITHHEQGKIVAAQNLESPRQEFLAKYGVKVLADCQVSFTLPSGTSRLDFLNEAQALARELINGPAVEKHSLAMWAKDAAFTTKVTEATSRSIDGNVSNSADISRKEGEAKGWNNVDLADLATAHQAFLIATGKNLFNGNVVYARGGELLYDVLGLSVNLYGIAGSGGAVASAYLQPKK